MQMFKVGGVFFTDIITNSSSVVYTWATSKENLYNVIDEVLQEVGSDKTAKDLFDIYIIADTYNLSDYMDELVSEEESLGFDLNLYHSLKWPDQKQFIEGLSFAQRENLTNMYMNSRDYIKSSYLVVTKDGRESKISSLIGKLFGSKNVYDG